MVNAVDCRTELDLRIGAAFTRLQTLHLQKHFANILDGVISYGSCQFPTLGFVVERYKAIKSFVSEQFWKLFDMDATRAIHELCKEAKQVKVVLVDKHPKSKWRPQPLDAIEMEKLLPVQPLRRSLADRKPTRNVEITAEQESSEIQMALQQSKSFIDSWTMISLAQSIGLSLQIEGITEKEGGFAPLQKVTKNFLVANQFLTEDLKIGGSDRARREKAFHHNNDESITVDDLWEAWFQSEERDWTEKEVVEWLKTAVKLPQYTTNFINAKVSGIALPRMAIQNSSYIANVLGIKNFVHRQKLQLKALDVVLFGFQDMTSRLKDIALAALVVLLVTILVVFKAHKNRSRRQMEQMSTRLTELMSMENDFEGAQQKLEQRRHSHVDHIEELKTQLMEAERRIEMNGYDSVSYALQPLLRRTYELENGYINAQKLECLNEMREAKDYVDKMRRKQTGLVASFKIATGTTSGTDDIDTRIFSLKARMEKIKMCMDECQQRWIEVESLTGFSITGPFGSTTSPAAGLIHTAESGYLAPHRPTPPSSVASAPQKYSSVVNSSSHHLPSSVYDDFGSSNTTASAKDFSASHYPIQNVEDWEDVQPAQQQPIPRAVAQLSNKQNGIHLENGAKATLPKYSLQHHNNATSTDDSQSISSSNSKLSNVRKSSKISQLFRRKITKP
uniref:SAM domain-containing protein n=1 Tax=Ditylenchus dipsaci TaxID=166011 RepID=A0A915ECW2_9BILA